jgi:hypothetical protein
MINDASFKISVNWLETPGPRGVKNYPADRLGEFAPVIIALFMKSMKIGYSYLLSMSDIGEKYIDSSSPFYQYLAI